jgi:hypothetical protein
MTRRKAAAFCSIVALLAFVTRPAYAERWVQIDPEDPHLWYDADNVRPTANGLVTVWISAGSTRTVAGPDGTTIYPTYSVIDCRARTAGSKISFDLGEALQPYDPTSSMGELIARLCSFQSAKGWRFNKHATSARHRVDEIGGFGVALALASTFPMQTLPRTLV